MAVYYNDNDSQCCAVLRQQIAAGALPKGVIDERDIRDVEVFALRDYTHHHLFAGIGGFPLGLAWAGVPTSIRLLSGGFPCQDISNSGRRAGIAGERSGLWREMVRLVRGLRPDYVLVENVAALLGRGMGTVLGNLAESGYDAEWCVLHASDVGAPHQRARIFLVAYPARGATAPSPGRTGWCRASAPLARETLVQSQDWQIGTERAGAGRAGLCPAADLDRWQAKETENGQVAGQRRDDAPGSGWAEHPRGWNLWWAAQSGLGRGPHGLPSWLDSACWPTRPGEPQHAWEPPRLVSGPVSQRSTRLRMLGNSIVPQLVVAIGRGLLLHSEQRSRYVLSGLFAI